MAKGKKAFKVTSSTARVRKFDLISYLSEDILKVCLMNHRHQIRVCAYALHDKDVYFEDVYTDSGELKHTAGELKEPHFHIVLVTHCTCTVSAVRRWFYGWYDDKGEMINTLGQKALDVNYCYDYLTHSDTKSRMEGKYLYAESIIRCNDHSYFKGDPKSEWDNSQLIIDSMLSGVDYQTLRHRFGRDFILNFDKYKYYCEQEEVYGKYNLEEEWCKNAKIQRENKLI